MTTREQAGNARNPNTIRAIAKLGARHVSHPGPGAIHRAKIKAGDPVPRRQRRNDSTPADEMIEAQFDNLPV